MIAQRPILLQAKDILHSPEQIWRKCRERAGLVLLTPIISLTALFWIVFGVGYAVIGGESGGWIIAAAVAVALLVLVSFDNIKLWMIMYPLVFLAPRLKLGDWSGGGREKLFGVQLYEPFILMLLCLSVPRLTTFRRLDLPRVLKVALAALALIGLHAVKIGPDRMGAVREGGRLLFEPLLLFVMIVNVRWRRAEVRSAAVVLLCVAALVAAISLAGHGTSADSGLGSAVHAKTASDIQTARLESYWEGTNILAAFLVATVPVSVGVIISTGSFFTLATGFSAVVLEVTAIALTYTRGAWVALAVSLFFMAVQLRRIRWPLVGILLLIGAALVAPQEMIERSASIVNFKSERSVENRMHMWHYAAPLVAQKPLTGYGFGGFTILFGNQSGIMSENAHNLMLDYALALGIPGLLIALTVIGYVLLLGLRTVGRGLRESPDVPLLAGLCAGCIGMLAAGMTDGSIPVWPILAHSFWFILALTWVMTRLIESNLSNVKVVESDDKAA